jgi:hypothetical protein
MNLKDGLIFAVVFAGLALVSHAFALYMLNYSVQYVTYSVVSRSQYVLVNVVIWTSFGFLFGLFADQIFGARK